MNEFEIMKMLDHPNVLKAVDIIYNDTKVPSILYEKCPTDLNQAIQTKTFSKVQLVYSIFEIAEGMKYIHSHKIIHLNLKPRSILISEDGTIKIGDFKNAEKVTSENEIKENDDIYSFGEIIYFILSGREINDSEKESVIESFPLLAQQLIKTCFYNDLECRPTFEMICDILLQNNFNLISLSQQEIEDVSKLISQYQQNSMH